MIVRTLGFAIKAATVFALAALVAGCSRGDEIMTVKYPLIWAGIVAGGPTGEWLSGDCDEFAPPRRQAQLCAMRRDIMETPTEREARLQRARVQSAVCVRSLADRTCHGDVVFVLPGQE